MLKTLLIATLLLPTLAFAQRSQQLPQPRPRVGWRVATTAYRAPTRRRPLFPRTVGVRRAGARAAVIASVEGTQTASVLASLAHSTDRPRRTNVWRGITSPARRPKRLSGEKRRLLADWLR